MRTELFVIMRAIRFVEVQGVLARVVRKDCAPSEVFAPEYPDTFGTTDSSIWNGIPVIGSIKIRQFTYVADYQDYFEVAAMTGRLYGPKAKQYFMNRKQPTLSWRLQIIMGQVSK